MSKLITPVQYEPALEELNAVRPLHLQERPRFFLDVPILNKLPKESVKIIAGTLAKCTPDGALLKKNVEELTGVQTISKSCSSPDCGYTVTFAQKVYKVLVNVTGLTSVVYLGWTDSSFSISLINLNGINKYYLDFIGTSIYFRCNTHPMGNATFDVYGFY